MEADHRLKRAPAQRPIQFEDTLTFRLPHELAGAVDAQARERGKSKSEWLRDVLCSQLYELVREGVR